MMGTIFLGVVQALGLVNPQVDNEILGNGEWFPSQDFRVFKFDNDYKDQYGVDDWDVKNNLAFNSSIKKFGTYSLTKSGEYAASLMGSLGAITGECQAAAIWVYVAWNEINEVTIGPGFIFYWNGENYIRLFFSTTGGVISLKGYTMKSGTESGFFTIKTNISNNNWHYIGFTYNKITDRLYPICDFSWREEDLEGSWPVTPLTNGGINIYLNDSALSYIQLYINELLYFYNKKWLSPFLLIMHNNHNVPWNTTYAKDDLTLIAKTGARVVANNKLKINEAGSPFYSPVSTELSTGTFHAMTPTEVYNADPGTGTIAVDCSSIVPSGTKAVLVDLHTVNASANSAVIFYSDSTATTRWVRQIQTAGVTNNSQAMIGVDAAKKFYFVPSASTVSSVILNVIGYWI